MDSRKHHPILPRPMQGHHDCQKERRVMRRCIWICGIRVKKEMTMTESSFPAMMAFIRYLPVRDRGDSRIVFVIDKNVC